MILWDTILHRLGLVTQNDLIRHFRKQEFSQRRFAGGVTNRLNADWRPTDTTADSDIMEALISIRAKARDLCNNNEIGKKFLRMCRKNIPGAYGFKMLMKIRKSDNTLDSQLNKILKAAHIDWSKPEHCTVTGTMSLRQLDQLITMHLVRDGEFLLRKVYNSRSKYGFQLQVLEPDLLDETYNAKLSNGNVIIMGIELDPFRRPVAYHLRKYNPQTSLYSFRLYTTERESIPASEIYHYFDRERAFQTRGITWYAPTMLRLRMLSAWEEAALFNARVSASKMGFFKDPATKETPPYQGTSTDAQGNIISAFEPGSLEDIGQKDFVGWDPQYPQAQHEMYVKSTGRSIASGFDVSYAALFSDLTDVNYSSIRQGSLDERETWIMFQEDLIEAFKEPCFRDWLEIALLSGVIQIPSDARQLDPMLRFDELNRPFFIGRRWDWIDPESDTNAKLKMLRSGMTSLMQIAAERGDDLEEIFQEIAEVDKMAKQYGVTLIFDEGKTQTAQLPTMPATKPKNGQLVPVN